MAGLYAADGSINVTVVSGNAWTGLYAADGSYNIVLSDGTSAKGRIQHPCGALYAYPVYTPGQNIRNTDGALKVTIIPYVSSGAQRVTAVSGFVAPSWVTDKFAGTGAPTPDIYAQFNNNRAFVKNVGEVSIASLLTVVRASTEYAQDTSGNWTSFSSNTPAYTNAGLNAWESRTNSIRTSDMTGAMVGADGVELLQNNTFSGGSGATCPNWTVNVGSGTVNFTGTSAQLTGDGSTPNTYIAQQITGLVIGRQYIVSLVSGSGAVGIITRVGTAPLDSTYALGTLVGLSISNTSPDRMGFVAGATTAWVTFSRQVASQATILSFSVSDGEHATNSDFAANPINASQNTVQNGWQWSIGAGTGTVTWTGSGVTLVGDGTNNAAFGTAAIPTVAGVTYTVTFDVATANVAARVGTAFQGATLFSSTSFNVGTGQKLQFTATTSTSFVTFTRSAAGGSTTIDNVSVQSAGKLPNNWTRTLNSAMIGTVVSLNSALGLPGLQYRIQGTPSSTSINGLNFESSTGAAASVGQTWTGSFIAANAGGTQTNIISTAVGYSEQNSGGTTIQSGVGTSITLSTTPARYQHTRSLTDTTTAFVNFPIRWNYSDTVTAVDWTFTVAGPQYELNPSTQALTAPTTAGGVGGSPGTLPTTSGVAWVDTIGALTRTLAFTTVSGQNVMQESLSGTAPSTNFTLQTSSSANAPAISVGEQVVGTVYFQTQTDDANVTGANLILIWLNSSNVEISRVTQSIYAGRAVFQQVSVSGTAPANTAKALLVVQHTYTGTPVITYSYYVGPWSLTPNRGMATPFISTASAAATRAADVISVQSAYVPTFSALGYTSYVSWVPRAPLQYSQNQSALVVADGTIANRHLIYRPLNGGIANFVDFIASAAAGGGILSTLPVDTIAKEAFASAPNSQAFAQGGSSNTSSSATIPTTLNTISFSRGDGTVPPNGQITEFAIWGNTRLSNATLQAITT